jgi:2-polyprenyl-3-methyl-5-hydroxy-6-metoxy-1,4-benzoquinol methylase
MLETQEYEYGYNTSEIDPHSLVVLPGLLEMLSQHSKSINKPPKILDLGCGNGSLTHTISQHGYNISGIEESASGVELARKSYPDCQFIQASIYDPPDKEHQHVYDVVMAVEVIEHLFFPTALLRAARQYLKPGGRLILSTPYHGYLKNVALALTGSMDKHYGVLYEGGHIKFFSVKTLTQLLEQQNYANIQFGFVGRAPYLWKSMISSAIPS